VSAFFTLIFLTSPVLFGGANKVISLIKRSFFNSYHQLLRAVCIFIVKHCQVFLHIAFLKESDCQPNRQVFGVTL